LSKNESPGDIFIRLFPLVLIGMILGLVIGAVATADLKNELIASYENKIAELKQENILLIRKGYEIIEQANETIETCNQTVYACGYEIQKRNDDINTLNNEILKANEIIMQCDSDYNKFADLFNRVSPILDTCREVMNEEIPNFNWE